MIKPHYSEHERRRHAARIAWATAILDDVEARVLASSDPDSVIAYPIADYIFAWELDEGAEEIRQAIAGPLSWDDSPGADEQPPPALAALEEARANLARRAAFYAGGEPDRAIGAKTYRLDSSETFLERAITSLNVIGATNVPAGSVEWHILGTLTAALERSLADGPS